MTEEKLYISNELVFEILKIVFFIVTYLLITDGVTNQDQLEKNYSSFYNTLFIFSASTWIEYLSMIIFQKHKQEYYDGKHNSDTLIPIICSLVGIVTVSISLYCVCKGTVDYIYIALFVYYFSMFFIFVKAYTITIITIRILKH